MEYDILVIITSLSLSVLRDWGVQDWHNQHVPRTDSQERDCELVIIITLWFCQVLVSVRSLFVCDYVYTGGSFKAQANAPIKKDPDAEYDIIVCSIPAIERG